MKNILYTIILSFLFSFSVFADWEAAQDAYEAGDYKAAFRLIKPLAEQGNARAQQNLGVMYYEGLGVIKNIVISYMWLNIAASKGEKNAKNNLGVAKRNMTSEQIAKAQELARECQRKNYKDCG